SSNLHCTAQGLLCLGKTRFTCQNQTKIYIGLCILRIVFRGLTKELLCLLILSLLPLKHAQVALCLGIARIQSYSGFQFLLRLSILAGLQAQESQLFVCASQHAIMITCLLECLV